MGLDEEDRIYTLDEVLDIVRDIIKQSGIHRLADELHCSTTSIYLYLEKRRKPSPFLLDYLHLEMIETQYRMKH